MTVFHLRIYDKSETVSLPFEKFDLVSADRVKTDINRKRDSVVDMVWNEGCR